MRILLVDHYDSFVYNLARYVGLLGHMRKVIRYDDLSLTRIENAPPDAMILSPGPQTPTQIPLTLEIIERFAPKIPILGVCLGHQAIGEVYGGQTIPAPHPIHGKASPIHHAGMGLFQGVPAPFPAARYHSLISVLEPESDLEITAQTEDNIPMAFSHRRYPVYSVQFHPESCLTTHGLDIMQNFLNLSALFHDGERAQHG